MIFLWIFAYSNNLIWETFIFHEMKHFFRNLKLEIVSHQLEILTENSAGQALAPSARLPLFTCPCYRGLDSVADNLRRQVFKTDED